MSADTVPHAGAPRLAVTREVLRTRRRSITLWSVAVAAVSAMYTAFYPSVGADDEAMTAYIDNLPDDLSTALGFDAMTSPGGYLAATVFGILGPALLLVFAIGTGAALISGQEEDGTLELECAAPVSRTSIVVQRFLALVLGVTALTASVGLSTGVLIAGMDIDVPPDRLAAGLTGLGLLALAFGGIALAAGAATGRRAVALGVASALAVLAYAADALAALHERGGWLAAISPWSWYAGDEPLTNGWDTAGITALALLTAAVTTAGATAFGRRDIGT
jgi:ABC-2 type transport system permease protein